MAMSSLMGVLRRLSRGASLAGSDDGLLLTAFIERRDASAFESLVQRHGPMVLGVCQRILSHAHDAEDAFQAVFIVLARKAESIRPRDMVGHWLHGVAYRTALQARSAVARRRSREMPVENLPEPTATPQDAWRDLQPVLDEEVNRLPAHYRAAVVLCELEGRSRTDAAQLLGIPEGTLSSRLAAARKILADRLTRRGLALPAASLATLLPANIASASVPASLVGSVVQAALAASLPEAAVAGIVSANAVTLANGVMKSMFLSKLKFASAWVLGVGLAAGGVGFAVNQALADAPKPSAERPNAKPVEGDKPRNPNVPRDGEKPAAGPKDGEKPRTGPKDGDKPKTGPKDGDKPAGTPRDGDKPALGGGRGDSVTLTGTISKTEVKRKKDDGSEVSVTAFVLTDEKGAKYPLPAPRVSEGGKVLDTFNLADFDGKSVVVTGRAFVAEFGNEKTSKRVVRLISISDVKAK